MVGLDRIVIMVAVFVFFISSVECSFSAPKCRVEPRTPSSMEVSRAVELYPSWSVDECVMIRFPETVWTPKGWLFMCNWPGHGPSPMASDEPPTNWRRGADGSLSYERAMNGANATTGYGPGNEIRGLAYGGKLTPRSDCIDMEFFIRNDTDEPIPAGVDFCLICSKNGGYEIGGEGYKHRNGSIGEFSDYNYTRTYIHTKKGWLRLSDGHRGPIDGKMLNGWWCSYALEGGKKLEGSSAAAGAGASNVVADEGIIVIASSRNSRRKMAYAWTYPENLMNNCRAPCIHSSPKVGELPARGKVVVKGKLYFLEATLDQIYKRYIADFGHLSEQQARAPHRASQPREANAKDP